MFRLPGGLLFLPVFAMLWGLFLPLGTELVQKTALYHTAGKLSLNTWYFYFFKEPFFLDFDFSFLTPQAPFFSALAHLVSPPVALFLSGSLLIGLFLFFPLPREGSLLRSLALVFPFFYFGYGESIALWIILWLSWLTLHEKESGSRYALLGLGACSVAGVLISPGVWPIFLLLWGRQILKEYGYKGFAAAFVLPLFVFLLWSMAAYSVMSSQWGAWLALPVTAWVQKYAASGEGWGLSFLANVEAHFIFISFHFLALGANLVTIYRRDKKQLAFTSAVVGAILIFWAVLTRGDSSFVLSAAVAATLFYPGQSNDSQKFSLWLWGWVVPALAVALFFSPGSAPCQKEKAEVRWVVSAEDLSAFDLCPGSVAGIDLLDTKIIPSNVKTLSEEPLAHDGKPIMSRPGIEFLVREESYAEALLEDLRDEPFSVLAVTRIHPAQEKSPYRRLFFIWAEMLQNPKMERRLVLRGAAR